MYIKLFDQLEKYILLAITFIVPLSVLPFFPNYFTTTKLVIFVGLLSLAVLVKLIKSIIKGTLTWASGIFDFPLLLLGLAYLVSAIWKTPNKMEAFFVPGNTTLILASILFYFLINQVDNITKYIKVALILTAAIFSLVTIFTTFKLYSFFNFLPEVIKNPGFNLEGSSVSIAIFLICLIPVILNFIFVQKKLLTRILGIMALVITVAGIAASIVQTLPQTNKQTNLPSIQTSWSIAFDTLKLSPLLGVGPGNYITAYNLYRPLSSNSLDSWNLRFTSSRSTYLTIVTETGLIGLAAVILLLSVIFKKIKRHFAQLSGKIGMEQIITHSETVIPLALLVLLLVLFPASTSLLILLAILLALNSESKISTINMTTQMDNRISRFPAVIFCLPFIGATSALIYYTYTAVLGETYYNQALKNITGNLGKPAYDNLIKAININPMVDRYHLSYAQLNLALAATIAQNQNLTDADKATVSQLVEQAIREGKSAVTLNQQRSGNWATLANIYQTVMPLATDADKFAIQTFIQAITLDPINPDLRINLGSLYLSLKQTDEAIGVLNLAVTVKPNYANAHYNLAAAYKAKGDNEKAKAELAAVLSLLDKDSADYQKAKDELSGLEPITLPQTDASPTPEIPALNPPLELPEEATPPASP